MNKTRISFQARVRFAGVSALRKDGMIVGFWLKRRIDSPRFQRVEFIPPDNHIYRLMVRSRADFDAELDAWLREAYRVGTQADAKALRA